MKPFRLLRQAVLLLALTCHSASAQRANKEAPGGIPPGPVSLAPGEAFVGNWEWAAGGEVFRITLTRNPTYQNPRDPRRRVMNVVTGQHRYTRSGTVIEQSYTGSAEPYSLFGVPVNNSSMRMGFHDLTKNRYADATLVFVPGNPNQLTWQLQVVERMYVYPDVAPSAGFTVPTTLTLTRVP